MASPLLKLVSVGGLLALAAATTFAQSSPCPQASKYGIASAAASLAGCASGGNLTIAPSEDLLKLYAQLRDLHGSDTWAFTENAEWQRDAATFTFVNGHLSFAEPVAGRVLAAYFKGNATVQIKPPTPALQRQLALSAGAPVVQDEFKEAVFFFTDDSWEQLQKLLYMRRGADAQVTTKALHAAQKKYAKSLIINSRPDLELASEPHTIIVESLIKRNLAARMLADLTDPSSGGFFLADFKGHRYGDLLYQISWNRDPLFVPCVPARSDFGEPLLESCLDPDEEVVLGHYESNSNVRNLVFGYQSELWNWRVGFHLAEEYAHTAWPEHRTLFAHCRQEIIDADVAQDNRLSATASMEIEVPGGTARVLPFSLAGLLRISSILDAQGRQLSFIQEAPELDSDPWVILPEPAAPRKVYNLKIAYQEEAAAKNWRIVRYRKRRDYPSGIYFVGGCASWLPRFAFDDRTHYKLHFFSPKRLQFLAAGRLVKSTQDKEALESDWDSDVPVSEVGFSYGDFAEKSHSDDHLTVNAYRPPYLPIPGSGSPALRWERQLDDTPDIGYLALRLYQYYFGPIPFTTLSVTQYWGGWGGVFANWPALVSLAYTVHPPRASDEYPLLGKFLSYWNPPFTAQSGWSSQVGSHKYPVYESYIYTDWEFYNLDIAREMARQWWGLMVGCKTYHDEWISYGFAEFSEGLFIRKFHEAGVERAPGRFQVGDVRSFWDLNREVLFGKYHGAYYLGHRRVDLAPLYLRRELDFPDDDPYWTISLKGGFVLEMLRVLFEDPQQAEPDARFISMMHDFTSTFANRNASTADFQRIVEKHMGEPMDWFFNEWVYGTEIPEYTFHYVLEPGDGGKTILRIFLTQAGVSDDFMMRVPVYVTVDKTSRLLARIEIKGSTTIQREIVLPFRPHKVTLDEYHDFLCIEHQSMGYP